MSPLSSPVRVLPRCRPRPGPTPISSTPISSQLPHWSDVPSEESPSEPPIESPSRARRCRLAPQLVAVLRDLAMWGADLAARLVDHCPEDLDAIARVRDCALACLAGEPCPDVELADVLTTAAAIMASIDGNVGHAEDSAEDERAAIGAPVDA